MKRQIGYAAAAFLALAAALSAATAALGPQDEKTQAQSDTMAKWKAIGTPGEGHKVLEKMVGKWTVTTTMRETPDGPAQMSNATTEFAWILDRHYLEETVTGSFQGESFVGRGFLGYDNFGQKYVMTWMDNMSTMIMTSEGTYDPAMKEMRMTGQCPDFATGKYVPTRSVIQLADPDHWTARVYKAGPDGKEFVAAEMDYRRAKT